MPHPFRLCGLFLALAMAAPPAAAQLERPKPSFQANRPTGPQIRRVVPPDLAVPGIGAVGGQSDRVPTPGETRDEVKGRPADPLDRRFGVRGDGPPQIITPPEPRPRAGSH